MKIRGIHFKKHNVQKDKITVKEQTKAGVRPAEQNQDATSGVPQVYKRKKWLIMATAAAIVLVGGAASSYAWYRLKKPASKQSDRAAVQLTAGNGRFAEYKELKINATPSIPEIKVDPGLSNVENLAAFSYLSENEQGKQILSKLEENQFAVANGFYREYYPLYESNRYVYTPNVITTDSMLHNYHIMFDHSLRQLEEEQFSGRLDDLSKAMLKEAESQFNALKGTEWENAAKRNVGLFAVGAKLVDPQVSVPAYVQDEVNQELALIQAHTETFTPSPVMNIGAKQDILENLKEDYTQYVPRGHYDKSDKLKAYFKGMMWYGRMTFRFKNTDEVKSAALITVSLQEKDRKQLWDSLYQPINFFVGKSDDITFYQMTELLQKTYGKDISLKAITSNQQAFNAFVQSTATLDPPKINSIPIFNEDVQPDRDKEITGFRFMGQRFTIDASIFQRLVDREVPGRALPKGLDIPAAMGSDEALDILTDLGETTKYPKYSDNMSAMQQYLSNLSLDDWTQNLYWSWLHTLQPLTDDKKPEGYPTFMRNQAWDRKELNTFLGSWTELKHDTILYAKQVYGEKGGDGPDKQDDRGYVEPNPAVYGRLASTVRMTIDGLGSRGLLSDSMKQNFERLETLALSLKEISEKELNNQKLSDADYSLIRNYGGDLEHFWLEVNKDEPELKQLGQDNFLDQNPAALVADVATDTNRGEVLEEATGYIAPMYVLFQIDGKLHIGIGGVYTQYEFAVPQDGRMTDKDWWQLLENRKAPDMPAWTNMFHASN